MKNKRHHIIRRISAVLLGFVLLIAGLLKLMDPVGAGLVVEEYLHFLHLDFLLGGAKFIGVTAAFLEALGGAALMAGVFRTIVAIVISLMMTVFTLITVLLVIFNPEMDCGCFGEAIHLTHWQTLIKNLALCVLCAVSFLPNPNYTYTRKAKYIAFALVSAVILAFGIVELNSLPIIDFMTYPRGSELLSSADDDIMPDREVYVVYEKNGQQGQFTRDAQPDSTWTFVKYAETEFAREIYDKTLSVLSIKDENGEYADYVADEGIVALYSIYDIDKFDASDWQKLMVNIAGAESAGYTPVLLTTDRESVPENLLSYAYTSDRKDLLTLNRSNGGVTYLRDGMVINKWSAKEAPSQEEWEEILTYGYMDYMLDSSTGGRVLFQGIILYSFAVLLFL